MLQSRNNPKWLIVQLRRNVFNNSHLLEDLLKEVEIEALPNKVIRQQHTDRLDMLVLQLKQVLRDIRELSHGDNLKLYALHHLIIDVILEELSEGLFFEGELVGDHEDTFLGALHVLVLFEVVFVIVLWFVLGLLYFSLLKGFWDGLLVLGFCVLSFLRGGTLFLDEG